MLFRERDRARRVVESDGDRGCACACDACAERDTARRPAASAPWVEGSQHRGRTTQNDAGSCGALGPPGVAAHHQPRRPTRVKRDLVRHDGVYLARTPLSKDELTKLGVPDPTVPLRGSAGIGSVTTEDVGSCSALHSEHVARGTDRSLGLGVGSRSIPRRDGRDRSGLVASAGGSRAARARDRAQRVVRLEHGCRRRRVDVSRARLR